MRRWRSQWDRVATRALPDIEALHRLLARALPESGTAAIVHGDYRLDNTILEPGDSGRIAAIVDWEMATLGDPLADLGMLLMYWDPVCEPVLGARHVPRPTRASPRATSSPTVRHALRPGHHELAFYQALGCFKLAVIAEGIHARYRAGQTVGAGFDGSAPRSRHSSAGRTRHPRRPIMSVDLLVLGAGFDSAGFVRAGLDTLGGQS